MEELKQLLDECGQSHIYEITKCLDKSESGESHPIVKQLTKLDLKESINHFKLAHEVTPNEQLDFKPVPSELLVTLNDLANNPHMKSLGIKAIQNSEVAAVILSGGQGTRLGYNGPKGMYDIGLPSHKSIFQLHVEKILKLLSLYQTPEHTLHIPIYIMTSDLNHHVIAQYFADNHYFNYPKEDIIFFEQGLEPCYDFTGKILLESLQSLCLAPDGNGGVYRALKQSKSYEDMLQRGIKHLHIYGIDNVLTRSCDPVFLGACIHHNVQVGNKVVWREHAGEKVGVTADLNGKMYIIEYSEIPPALASALDAEGKLLYGAANICNHYLSLTFLSDQVLPHLSSIYHTAHKKIPCYDPVAASDHHPTANNGVKIEMFVFDIFPLASKWVVVESERGEEFAPVKNEPGSAVDSPDTARRMCTQQAVRWLERAGAKVVREEGEGKEGGDGEGQCEISPLLSYAGEGLEEYRGREVRLPVYLH